MSKYESKENIEYGIIPIVYLCTILRSEADHLIFQGGGGSDTREEKKLIRSQKDSFSAT